MPRIVLPQDANPTGIVLDGVAMIYFDEDAGAVAVRHAEDSAVTVPGIGIGLNRNSERIPSSLLRG